METVAVGSSFPLTRNLPSSDKYLVFLQELFVRQSLTGTTFLSLNPLLYLPLISQGKALDHSLAGKMSTLADELLNDFGDSGSEDEQQNGLESQTKTKSNGHHGGLDVDMDEADGDDTSVTSDQIKDIDEDNIENLKLGHIQDVRSISKLRGTLEPILEVSHPFLKH